MKLNSTTVKLDEIDRKILEILQTNAKITNAQLSKDIGLSPAPTLERVKKLENSGIIKSYHPQLDTDRIGLGVHTFVQVTLKGHNKKNIDLFLGEINQIPEIIECYQVTGNADYFLKVVVKDIPSFESLISNKLSQIEEIGQMQTMMILSKAKDSKVIPFEID